MKLSLSFQSFTKTIMYNNLIKHNLTENVKRNLLSEVYLETGCVGEVGFRTLGMIESSVADSSAGRTNRQTKKTQLITVKVQWAPLNGITLGQRKTDSNNRMILISESTKHTLGRKW
jgi:hypothetical protein